MTLVDMFPFTPNLWRTQNCRCHLYSLYSMSTRYITMCIYKCARYTCGYGRQSQIARVVWPTWGPPGSWRPQVGPMLAPWITFLAYHQQLLWAGSWNTCYDYVLWIKIKCIMMVLFIGIPQLLVIFVVTVIIIGVILMIMSVIFGASCQYFEERIFVRIPLWRVAYTAIT